MAKSAQDPRYGRQAQGHLAARCPARRADAREWATQRRGNLATWHWGIHPWRMSTLNPVYGCLRKGRYHEQVLFIMTIG